jgi:hypothetical protein
MKCKNKKHEMPIRVSHLPTGNDYSGHNMWLKTIRINTLNKEEGEV